MIYRDKDGKVLHIGDRVLWRTGGYIGEVVKLSAPENERERIGAHNAVVKVLWDHSGCVDWYEGNKVSTIKFTESTIKDFFEEFEGPELGETFCSKFYVEDDKLLNELCPGKAMRRIIDVYAGDA